ncbi:CLUMA_CG005372, isoform A [Clunio marinus]|uniref:CLUMA_CG005372, isoform A n=1 Tax=Clunio marinus TaxID=568069 RepID=A0A1J1I028_9DIPT|nr:CLUMA_CG005372, isoform A [Clunio marinus]
MGEWANRMTNLYQGADHGSASARCLQVMLRKSLVLFKKNGLFPRICLLFLGICLVLQCSNNSLLWKDNKAFHDIVKEIYKLNSMKEKNVALNAQHFNNGVKFIHKYVIRPIANSKKDNPGAFMTSETKNEKRKIFISINILYRLVLSGQQQQQQQSSVSFFPSYH